MEDMFDLITGVARRDERIRAVYMNGSRTNPKAPKDLFQDYDIVYVVRETSSFIEDVDWISVFGELLMVQEPDKNDLSNGVEIDFSKGYTYLMLFTDGNRIDLHLETEEEMLKCYGEDSLTVSLLDKDDILPQIPVPSEIGYHVKSPSELMYVSCCNEFFWCLQNVAKGIWRDELPYAKQMFEQPVRDALDNMVSWWIGSKHDFSISTGKMGKYFKLHLPEEYWNLYKETYSDANYENVWNSVFASCELFRSLATEVADYFSYTYPVEYDTNMTKYLKQVKSIPAKK